MREHIVDRTVHPELCGRHARRRGRELQSRPRGARRACARRDPAAAHQVEPEARAGGTSFATGETRTRNTAGTKASTRSRSDTNADTGARRTAGTRERASTGEHTSTSCASGSGDDTINGHSAAASCHDHTGAITCTGSNPGTDDGARRSGNAKADDDASLCSEDHL
jgi:hypothetical protein